MRLLRAALVALFLMGTELLAAPLLAGADDDPDRIDPLKSQDSFSSDVNRTKRKAKAISLATNMILNRLERDPYPYYQQAQDDRRRSPSSPHRFSSSSSSSTGVKSASNSRKRPRQVSAAADEDDDLDETTPFGEGGKVTLQIPGKVFGSATNLFLTVAKMFGDYITNSAIRTARFMQVIQPLFGKNLYIYIPPSTTESNDI